MCIIAFKPAGVAMPSRDILETCFLNNPDGAGYAIKRENSKKVYYIKGFFDFEELYNALTAENIGLNDAVGVHFRIATNGAIKAKNCHPFFISEEEINAYSVQGTCKSVLFHNGILSQKYSYDKKTSDSCLFARALAKKEKALIAKKAISAFIEKETEGSRILYFHADMEKPILTGNWVEDKETGCFFSNSSYSYVKSFSYNFPAYDFQGYGYGAKNWKTWTSYTGKELSRCDTKTALMDDFVNMCPYCGETINIKKISENYDLWECAECGELFDSFGNYVELKYYGE